MPDRSKTYAPGNQIVHTGCTLNFKHCNVFKILVKYTNFIEIGKTES